MRTRMLRSTRLGVAAAVALTGMLTSAAPAAAAPKAMVDVKKKIELLEDGGAATLRIAFRCPAGSSYSLEPEIGQVVLPTRTYALFDTSAAISGTCTGKRERIAVTVRPTTEPREGEEELGGYHPTLNPTAGADDFQVTTVSVAFTVDGVTQSYSSDEHVLR